MSLWYRITLASGEPAIWFPAMCAKDALERVARIFGEPVSEVCGPFTHPGADRDPLN